MANNAGEIHWQTHAQMQGNGADPVAINGRADAAHDANQETTSFFDLLLVPAEQLRYMRHTACQFPEHADEASDAPLSPETRERIKRRLAETAR